MINVIQNKTIAVALLPTWFKDPASPCGEEPIFETCSRADFEQAVKLALGNPDLAHIYKMAALMMLNGFVSTAPDESNWLTDNFTENEILAGFDLMREDVADVLAGFDKGADHA